MTKLKYILDNHRRHSQARQRGLSHPPGMDTEQAAGAIKALILELVGEDDPYYDLPDGNGYIDTLEYKKMNRNELRAALRAKVEAL